MSIEPGSTVTGLQPEAHAHGSTREVTASLGTKSRWRALLPGGRALFSSFAEAVCDGFGVLRDARTNCNRKAGGLIVRYEIQVASIPDVDLTYN
jgi:hypothetical protein